MARTLNIQAPSVPKHANPSERRRTLNVHVITPIFGGGVKPGEPDPVTLIRGTSIRGHLRFWWRATRGAQCSGVMDLREREGMIWGTTERPSPISLGVEIKTKGRSAPCATFPLDKFFPKFENGYPPYALFPFQGKKGSQKGVEKEPAVGWSGGEFSLHIQYPEALEVEIQPALWAWLNFGGIGARTRRGCGALFSPEYAPTLKGNGLAWEKEFIPVQNVDRKWSTLPTHDRLLCNPQLKSHLSSWWSAIDLLKEFRQGEDVGRNPGSQRNRPGRSRWPEPDTIRRITNQGSQHHRQSITGAGNAFPRAEYGLPIVFHFMNEQGLDCELYPADSERMGSPLILRPLGVGADGNESVPIILQLNTTIPTKLRLKQETPDLLANQEFVIRDKKLTEYNSSPMRSRSPSGSALESFIAFAKENGFR